MYLAEVLGKLPVIQHFLFGTILPYQGIPAPALVSAEEDAHWGHKHSHPHTNDTGAAGQREVGWGDCCGIPVPSAFGAAAAEKHLGGNLLSGPAIRPVPFD
jgi:serine/threonine-protein phosphatase 2A activator